MDIGAARQHLLELGRTVADFAQREQDLQRNFHSKTYHLGSDLEEAVEGIEAEFTESVEVLDEAMAEEKESLKGRYEGRKKRIAKGHKRSKQRLVENIKRTEGHQVYSAQREVMQGDRDLDQRLIETERIYGELRSSNATLQQRLAGLENSSRKSLGGFGSLAKQFTERLHDAAGVERVAAIDRSVGASGLNERLAGALDRGRDSLRGVQRRLAPQFFRYFPLPISLIVLALICGAAVPVSQMLEIEGIGYPQAGIAFGVGLVLLLAMFFVGKAGASKPGADLIDAMAEARTLAAGSADEVAAEHERERERIKAERIALSQQLKSERQQAAARGKHLQETGPEGIDAQRDRAAARNDAQYQARLANLEAQYQNQLAVYTGNADSQREQLTGSRSSSEGEAKVELDAGWQALQAEWNEKLPPMFAEMDQARVQADAWFPQWSADFIGKWAAPDTFALAARFGEVAIDVEKLAGSLPKDERLALPGPTEFTMPMLLGHPQHGSLILETNEGDKTPIVEALNNLILRLLSVSPPGKASFTIVDPVGLGENFAGVMHLADHEEGIINNRIWTQSAQIEQRLGELNDHMEKVIQMYLRNEYETITEYNVKAGNIAEKYHFLVVADFPAGFTDQAAKRLLSIAASGARCGVFALVHWNLRQPMPQDFIAAEFREACVRLTRDEMGKFVLQGEAIDGLELALDPAPSTDLATDFIHTVGVASKDSNRVEVPFSSVTPPEGERWSRETTSELVVPIGRTGATKFQELAIGKGTRQHTLIAGKTGSGKSTLFHVIITNLSLWCRPDQVEFYLIDFKKGVEFKSYATARLPHAKVVAIESDREFAESVLTRVDEELKRRGDLFRSMGVQDIAGYQRAGGTEPMPRTLLMIDEFQEFFVEEDRIAQNANVLLDRIVRQGRAFGIHVILGSQTLGGAYTLARTTMGQMVIRIALQCNEADAYLIMDDTNPAPRLLTRPGEGIYNDSAGAVEGNSPFQTVWISDEVRDEYLADVRKLADSEERDFPGPIVFEGNAPAEVRENHLLERLLKNAPAVEAPGGGARIWFGAPNSIKGPTEVQFLRQSGCNLLIAGQRDEAALSILTVSLVALAAQYPKDGARFVIFDGSAPDSSSRRHLEALVDVVPHEVVLAKHNTLGEAMGDVHADLKRRGDSEKEATAAPATFLFVYGIQRIKKLRYEEDFSFSLDVDEEEGGDPGNQLNDILLEGPGVGIHTIVICDTFNNIGRFLSRKAISEFELRVLFQMSANDSASLIDTPKAANLGLHRALFYNEQEGYLETFRPYALPGTRWMEEVKGSLQG